MSNQESENLVQETKKEEVLDEGDEEEEEIDVQITETEKQELKMKIEEPSRPTAKDAEDIARAKALFEKETGIEIQVCNPQEKKGGAFSKNYTTYDVVGKDKNGKIQVSRRYKEFDLLRTKLKENWPGIFIPALPEKKVQKTAARITTERLIFLDHFIKKCAKMDHIFYSEEMQIFLHSTGSSDELMRHLNQLPIKSCSTLYHQYKMIFPEYQGGDTKDLESIVFKKLEVLKVVLQDVDKMRNTLKKMTNYRGDFKHLKSAFVNYLGKDAISKIKDPEIQAKQKTMMRDFAKVEKQDDITTLNSNLKVLKKDIECFFSITNDLSQIYKTIGHSNGVITSSKKELELVKNSDKDWVSEGLFSKVPKEAKIRELESVIQKVTDELESAHHLKSFIFTMLDKQEIPLILYVKNIGMANGIMELIDKRTTALKKEQEVLGKVVEMYPQAKA